MNMDGLAIARALHVLGVVIWIGGVAMVTVVIIPAVKSFKLPQDRVHFFEAVEHRFSWIARAATLIVGSTGFYMVWQLDLWSRFADPFFWWMHAMVAVWAIFTIVLFIAEPLFLRRHFAKRAREAPESTFAFVQRIHWVLLGISLITIMGAVAGAHGFSWLN